MISENLLNQIKNHAHKVAPEECCGLIVSTVNDIIVFEAENISSEDRKISFSIDSQSQLMAEEAGKVIGYYHSHNTKIQNEVFSDLDIQNFKIHGLFSVVYNTINDQFCFLSSEKSPKYVGREFKIGKDDCFSLLRDYYKNELSIEIKDYHRDSRWYIKEPTMWMDNFDKEGCVRVYERFFNLEDLKIHDILVAALQDMEYPSHALIYLGNNLILHHPVNKHSTIEPLDGDLKNQVRVVFRHRSQL